ncbi:MAG: cytochrome c553, partial [Zhongshania sp.]
EQAAMAAQETLQQSSSADGSALYAACTACHGASGEGNKALAAPSLVNQQDWYLRRQLMSFRTGLRGSHPQDAYGMQMQMQMLAKSLPDEAAVDAVVAHIAGFKS